MFILEPEEGTSICQVDGREEALQVGTDATHRLGSHASGASCVPEEERPGAQALGTTQREWEMTPID